MQTRSGADNPATAAESRPTVVITSRGPRLDGSGWKRRIADALEAELAAGGYRILYVHQADEGKDPIRPLVVCLEQALDRGPAGVALVEPLAASGEVEAVAARLTERGVPHVWVTAQAYHAPAHSVYYDNEYGGYLAAAHLCACGHDVIAMPVFRAADWGDETRRGEGQGWMQERVSGAERACRQHGARLELLPVLPDDAEIAPGSPAAALFTPAFWEACDAALLRAVTAQRTARSAPATALITLNDAMALRLWDALRDAGTAVPDALSLVGFDDTPEGVAAGLTTIAPPLEGLGREAAGVLLRRMDRDARAGDVEHLLVRPYLVERASVLRRAAPDPPLTPKD